MEVSRQVKELLGSHALPLQIPIGAEDEFKGVVDLINFKGIVWNEEDQGMTFKEVEIPEDIIDEARKYRGQLLESVAEFDDTLLEKYFEDENSLTEREILTALRAATISGKVVPMMCGSAFKNKGVQAMLDMVMEILPSPLDVEAIIGKNPDTDEEESRQPQFDAPFSALAFKIATDPYVGRLCLLELIQENWIRELSFITQELEIRREFLEYIKCTLINRIKLIHLTQEILLLLLVLKILELEILYVI